MASLLLIGIILAIANIWVVAARSTIPIAIDAVVLEKEIRQEKHPGKDDVCLVHLAAGGSLHVDQAIYASLQVGDALRKEAWSRELTTGRQAIALEWSADFGGMVFAMPAILIVMLATATTVLRPSVAKAV